MEACMSWYQSWSIRHRRRVGRPVQRRDLRDCRPIDAEDVPPIGCAWFDSSHDLLRGLVVLELTQVISADEAMCVAALQ
jgi:hypothetical protein